MIISFTGHRLHKVEHLEREIKGALRKELIYQCPDSCISGMAVGVDQWACEVCLELGIPYDAAIPFAGQDQRWPYTSRAHWLKLIREASLLHIISEGGYSPQKMQIRNMWMVDHSDLLIAVWNGTPGGTANCVNYAKSVGREIVMIDPNKL